MTSISEAVEAAVCSVRDVGTAADAAVAAVQADLTAAQADLSSALATVVAVNANLAEAQSNLAAAQAELVTVQAALDVSEADLATAQGELATKQTALETAEASLASTEVALATTQSELATAQADLATKQLALDTAHADLAAAEAELAAAQAEIVRLQAIIDEFNAPPVFPAPTQVLTTVVTLADGQRGAETAWADVATEIGYNVTNNLDEVVSFGPDAVSRVSGPLPPGEHRFGVQAVYPDGVSEWVWGDTVTIEATPEPEPEPEPEPPTGSAWSVTWGTHWPAGIPRITPDTPGTEIPCTWPAIADAASNAPTGTVSVFDIPPGELIGLGDGSGSSPVLQSIDRRHGQVIFRPRDGYGTVKLTGNASIRDVHGVHLFGIDGQESGVLFRRCLDFSWGWSELAFWRVYDTSDMELLEIVRRESTIKEQDRSDFWGSGGIPRVRLRGGYAAPALRPAGSGYHTDDLQIEAVNGGTVSEPGQFEVEDFTFFGASNQTLQLAGVQQMPMKNTVVVGGLFWTVRYSMDGAYQSVNPKAINGGGTLVADGLAVFGDVVANITITGTDYLHPPWTQAEVTAWLDEHRPKPTKEQLTTAWQF